MVDDKIYIKTSIKRLIVIFGDIECKMCNRRKDKKNVC